MERVLLEYLANAVWQIPLLALGGWLLLQALNAGLRVRHALWLLVLAASVLLPLRGIVVAPETMVTAAVPVAPALSSAELAALMASLPETASAPVGTNASSAAKPAPSQVAAPARRAAIPLSLPLAHRFVIHVAPRVAHTIVSLFAAVLLIGFFRLLLAWAAHREMVHRSEEAELNDTQMDMLRRHSASLGIPVPEVRVSSQVACPATLGTFRPVLLIPPGFLLHDDDDVEAAMCHELAHIARRDYLVNFLAKLGTLPVSWHPAVLYVQQQIHRTRELLCDAVAARLLSSELRYAHSLLALARSMMQPTAFRHAEAQGLFHRNTLEERIMHLTDPEPRTTFRTRALHALAGAAVISATLFAAATLHLAPVMAQETAAAVAPVAGASGTVLPALGWRTPALLLASVTQEQQTPTTLPQEPTAPALPASSSAPALPALPEPPAVAVPATPAAPTVPAPQANSFTITVPDSKELQHIIVEANRNGVTAWTNSEEFKQSMKDLNRTLQAQRNEFKMKTGKDGRVELWQKSDGKWVKINGDWQKNAEEWRKHSAEFAKNQEQYQKQMAEMSKQFNNADFQRQMEDLRKQLKSDEFKRQMEQAQRSADLARQNAELQRQMAEMQKDFQKQYAEGMREYQRELQQSMKELQKELEHLKKEAHNQ